MKKRLFSALLCLCMMVGMLPALILTAQAAEAYLWPVPAGKTFSRGYGGGHTGVDITSGGNGTNVIATKSGTVVIAYTGCGNYNAWGVGRSCSAATCAFRNPWYDSSEAHLNFCNWGYGNGVIIQHSDGSGYSMYGHMSRVDVATGATVRQGDTIGAMGSSGKSTGAHLHFELCSGVRPSGTYYAPVGSIDNNIGNITYIDSGSSITPSHPTAPSQRVTYNGQVTDNFIARIYNSYSGCYLENRNGNVQTANNDPYDPRQIWQFTHDDAKGAYKIVNMYDGRCLDALDGGTSYGTNVQTQISNNSDAQRWWLCGPVQEIGINNPFYFVPGYMGDHGLVMDIAGGDKLTYAGTNIQLFYNQYWDTGTHHIAQDFRIIKDNSYSKPSKPSAPTFHRIAPGSEQVTIEWNSVPLVNNYDAREYILEIYDVANSRYALSRFVAGTSYTASLPTGTYRAEIQAVNTKYPNYISGKTLSRDFTVYPLRTITLTASPAEGGTVYGGGTYSENTFTTLQAKPNEGWHFVGWTRNGQAVTDWEDDGGSIAEYGLTITGDETFQALFEQDDVPVYTIEVNTTGGGTVSGGGSYAQGASVTVTASPDQGCHFVSWTENGSAVSSDASYTFSVSADRTLTAVFEQTAVDPPETVKYTVSVNADPPAGGAVTGSGNYTENTSVVVTAVPNSGYTFKEWQKDGAKVSEDSSYYITVDGNQTLTAVFEKTEVRPASYTISLRSTSGGTVTGSGSYAEGASVTVAASPVQGYHFVEWQEDGKAVSDQSSYQFAINRDRVLCAVFATDELTPTIRYSVDVSAVPSEGGAVTGSGIFEQGAQVTVTATPNEGYNFLRWVADGNEASTDASYTFAVSESLSMTAVFELENPTPKSTYTITVSASPAEHGSVTGGGTYQEGEAVTITAIANSGYQFKEWWLNGRQISTTASYTFTASANQDFTAIFEKQTDVPTPPTPNTYTVSVSPATGGTVTGGGTFAENSTVTVTAIANSSYRFTGWFENGSQVSASASYTFIVNSDRNLVAGFTYVGGSTNTLGGNPSSGNANDTSTNRPSIPVKTDGTNNNMTTTASPNATIRGDTAASVITSEIVREIINQAVKNDSGEVVIAPVVKTDVTRAEVTLPAAALTEIEQKTNAGLVISTPHADVRLQNSGLSTLSDRQAVVVATERTGTALALSIMANGQTVEHVPGGVILTAPVDHSTPGTVAVVIHEDGSRQVIRKSIADGDTITIPFDGSARLEIIDNAKVFTDVNADSWAANAVAFVSGHELFSGTSLDTFSPDLPMTRGMLAMVLRNLENNPEQVFSARFSDVADSIWYSDAILWAAKQGIVFGYGDGRFGPNDNITREQLAVMLWRYAGEPAATNKELHFSDADAASSYALEALCWAVEHDIINGYGNGQLGPQRLATRAQVAQMLMNYLKK